MTRSPNLKREIQARQWCESQGSGHDGVGRFVSRRIASVIESEFSEILDCDVFDLGTLSFFTGHWSLLC